jgi:type VI secretion system secreted protein Hcp
MKLKRVVVLAALAAACLAPLTTAWAQQRVSFYVTIEGTKQGKFKGESVRGPQNQDKLEGLRFFYQVTSPRDVATGQASGKRQHSDMIFTKEWGAASPQIYQAMVTNEVLKSVVFEFVKPNQRGQEIVFQTIKLTNAAVSSVKQYIEFSTPGEPPDPRALEDVGFTFQKIEITNNEGRTSAEDTPGNFR